jgi:hypothetical protein
MLPVTVHGRVSDIWRGYAAQRILNLLNLRLIFSPALVKQVSSSCHPYLNCVAFSLVMHLVRRIPSLKVPIFLHGVVFSAFNLM